MPARWRRGLCWPRSGAAAARSAVFNSALPPRSRRGAGGGRRWRRALCWPRSGGGGAKRDVVSFSPVPARSAAPPAVGCGAEPYAGRVAAAEARNAVFNSAVPARSAASPAVGGGAEPYMLAAVARSAVFISRLRGGRRLRRALCCMAAVARSAVFNSAVPARSAAPPAAGGGAEGCVGRVAAAEARSAVFDSAVPALSAAPPAAGGGAKGCVGPRSGGGGAKRRRREARCSILCEVHEAHLQA